VRTLIQKSPRAIVGSLLILGGGNVFGAEAACEALKSASFQHTQIVSSALKPADASISAPAFCEVAATISPVRGSNIGVVYRLPEKWNGKMVGLGGGGWSGNTDAGGTMTGLKTTSIVFGGYVPDSKVAEMHVYTAMPSLKAGYATAQTDGGHSLPASREDVWRPDKWATPEALADFQYRAVHEMTVLGKAVVARYYGRPHAKAYFQGCSTGGRQALMEVQRYPEDYDGVVAMAPVFNLTVQTTAVVRDNVLGRPGAALTPELLARVNAAVLKVCDAQDGVADGLLEDPRQCAWDPSEVLCKAGQAGTECLTQPQVDSLRTLYTGVRTPDGRVVAWPLARGGERGWAVFIGLAGLPSDPTGGGGLRALAGPVLGDRSFNLVEFNPAKHFDNARTSAFAKAYEADDPNIAAFTRRGGKLLLWHGWNDPGPSPWLTLDYFERVGAATPDASASIRLYLSPGVGHCAGGAGPDEFDPSAALDGWVQSGRAPNALRVTKTDPKLSRLVCAYPKVARYKGHGDASDAASFECK
jgi:tannase/feruloyl esterase